MFNMPKNAFSALFSSWCFEIYSRNANEGICIFRKCSTCRKNAFLRWFHNQFLKNASETQIKAYAVVANVQHAEKRVFAQFSSSIFETASESQIMAYAAFAKVQHAEKRVFTRFSSSIFENCFRNANIGICSSRIPKNAFLHCFRHQFLKSSLETQIKAYAVFANVQHAEKRVFALFSSSIF